MERKQGYYWVYLFSPKNFSYEGWNVSRWDGTSFWYDGKPYNENCFSQIDELQIVREPTKLQNGTADNCNIPIVIGCSSEIIYDVDFGGHCKAGILVKDSNIEVLGAMNGWGDGIDKINVVKRE